MEELIRGYYVGERAMFAAKNAHFVHATFADGESPLKESENIVLDDCLFKWKYPIWYSRNVRVNNCTLFETARAGMWYTDDIVFDNCIIEAPKSFRHTTRLTLNNVTLPNAAETLWNCSDVTINNVTANGTYFAMNCRRVRCNGLILTGDYCFDGAQDVELRNCKLLSKDSLWNCRNVTVYDSFISGEYLAWNAENLTLVNCTVESLQGLCYVRNLKMMGCTLLNTTRAFEYSTVDAQLCGTVDSVVNPSGGVIQADGFGSVTVDERYVDPARTQIICRK